MRGDLPTILAAAATLYLIHVGPDVVRSVVEMIFWTNSDYIRPSREINAWYNAFETWRLSSYWSGAYPSYPFGGPGEPVTMTRSFLVCLVTAVPPLLLALWVFRRKAY